MRKHKKESVNFKIGQLILLRLRGRKKIRKSKSHGDLWNSNKWTNIHIIGVQKKRERNRLFEEIRVENFLNLMKYVDL